MQQNLTSGSVFQNVVRFSLPYLLSYFLQTLYGMADLFIVGQFEPVAATTAVSIGSQVMHMLTVMLVGLAMGTTVTIAQAVGAGDKKRAARAVGNTVTLFGGISALLTVVLLLLVRRITAVMSTPAEAVSGTVRYLTICFLGIPFITAYNVLSSIFRGMGDSKSPMYFIACACVCNIALDYLFMGALRLGPAGAAHVLLGRLEALLGGIARMRLDEQVVLHDERGEGDDVLAALDLLFGLVQGEDEHALQLVGDLRHLGARVLNVAIGHGGPPFLQVHRRRNLLRVGLHHGAPSSTLRCLPVV